MRFAADNGAKKVLMIWIGTAGILITAFMSALAGFLTPWILVVSGVIGLLTIFAAFWYPPRYIRELKGSFDGIAVRASKGVVFKRELFVPLSALRTFEISATPVQRLFHCRSVVLRFAGGAVILPLLPEKQAEQLGKSIKASDYDNS